VQSQLEISSGSPATTNILGSKYPFVYSDLTVTFRLYAPQAQKVQLLLGGGYEMTRSSEEVWEVTTPPQIPGFHYYSYLVDGANVCDPGSETFFGCNRQMSGIEIPEKNADFYSLKDVPHGEIRQVCYFSKTTKDWRRIFVYTPPGYDEDFGKRYPVLYLQHGGGEDERGWVNQGHVNLIMDNLIAEKKSKPMIIVMEKGVATPAGKMSAESPFGSSARRDAIDPNEVPDVTKNFESVVVNDLIPMIDHKFRTLSDRDHRAMAGLSMGGIQTLMITLKHLDLFAYIGGFSGLSGSYSVPGVVPLDVKKSYDGVFSNPEQFNKKVNLVWIGVGTAEGFMYTGIRGFHETLSQGGIKNTYYESHGTGHEWLTWRRCLHEFAPLLFGK